MSKAVKSTPSASAASSLITSIACPGVSIAHDSTPP
jgi:hypothetical protein